MEFINYIKGNADEIKRKMVNIDNAIHLHTWPARASKVASDVAAMSAKAAVLK